MNFNETYILNPAYYLRNDVHRSIIGSFDYNKVDESTYDEFFSFIYPVNAQILSFFDGKNNLKKCIENISDFFQLSFEEVCKIIEKYIENKESMVLKHNGNNISLPRNVLVKKRDLISRETYSPQDFLPESNTNIDLKSVRLFKPIRAVFELTFKCYTDCIYCYADRSRQHDSSFLSLEEIKSIIKQAKQCGLTDMDINGGEVLLHPNYKEILKELADNGFYPLISTKMPLNKEVLEYIKEIGFLNIQISLDSLNENTLVEILKVKPGYKEKILNTLQLIDEMGFNWQTNTILTKANSSLEDEIKPLINHLLNYKNIKNIKVGPAGCSLYKSQEHFDQIKVIYSDVVKLREFIEKTADENPHISISISEPDCETHFLPDEKEKIFSQRSMCTANQRTFIILPDGKVTICEELYWHPKFIIGDLRKQSILDIWNSDKAVKLFYIQNEMISDDSVCKLCGDFSACRHHKGVCWKVILMAYGKEKWDYPDPRCPKAQKPEYPFYIS